MYYLFRLRPNLPFEGKVRIPKMTMDAKYASTGVLLVLPANGNGTFHADLGLCYYSSSFFSYYLFNNVLMNIKPKILEK